MKYFEDEFFTKDFRIEYLNSILDFARHPHPLIQNEDSYINELGYPLTANQDEQVKVTKELLSKEENYSIYRYHFLILNEIKLTGLLFETNKDEPLVVYQHGFLGTPEVISAIYKDRNTYNYNDIVIRLLKLNKNVFCPQLLMWSIEKYGVNYNRKEIDDELRKVHSSLVGLETYLLKEIIHYFKKDRYQYIDLFGMSYGAYYTYQVSLVSKEIKTYWACSYVLTHHLFDETIFKTTLKEVIEKSFKNNDLYITLGDEDPIMDYSLTNPFIAELNDKNKIIIYHGNHEVFKDDQFLKKLFE